ncbi:hypothetical protein V6N13_071261 [Hibiscus sabdariffa]
MPFGLCYGVVARFMATKLVAWCARTSRLDSSLPGNTFGLHWYFGTIKNFKSIKPSFLCFVAILKPFYSVSIKYAQILLENYVSWTATAQQNPTGYWHGNGS